MEKSLYHKLGLNKYLVSGFILGVLQYLIYTGRYDYLLKFGPFVTHHFVELPAFFILGVGMSVFFFDLGWPPFMAQGMNAFMVALLLSINLFTGGIDRFIAAFIVSSPELIGFYLHRMREIWVKTKV
jgi:hypothetical protein